MKRIHRRWHLRLWLILGPLAVVLLTTAWIMRPRVAIQDRTASTTSAQTSAPGVSTLSPPAETKP